MNSVYNSSSDICCCTNKEQCFTPTLLSWSSIQLSSKSFTNSMTETGKYIYKHKHINTRIVYIKYRLRLQHLTNQTKNQINIEIEINHYSKPNSADCDRFEIYRFVSVIFASSSFFLSLV